MIASAPAIDHRVATKPIHDSNPAPMKKPTPFSAFFDPVRIATSLKSPPSPATAFTALFDDIFVRSFATPDSACNAMTNVTANHTGQSSERKLKAARETI